MPITSTSSLPLWKSYLQQVSDICVGCGDLLTVKLVLGAIIAVYSFFFHIDHWQLMVALTALISFDLLTGMWAAKVAGERIESRKVLKTAFKLAVYALLVSAGHFAEIAIGLPGEWAALEQMMIAFLAATELVSILENAGRAGYAVPQRLLNQLQQFRDSK